MRRMAAAVLIAVLILVLAGCGGGSGGSSTDAESGADAISLLAESTNVMTEASSYRMSGQMEMQQGASASGSQVGDMLMEVASEVQNTGDELRQYVSVSMSGYQADAYIVGGVYYQNVPGQGWFKMSASAFKAQNLSMNVMDTEQMQLMAELAENTEVFEEGEDQIGVSFHLGRKFFEASMQAYATYMQEEGQQIPEDFQQAIESPDLDFQADVYIWMNKENKLINRMEMEYRMAGMPDVGEVSGSTTMDFYDFNADIVIELPEEARDAVEFSELQ